MYKHMEYNTPVCVYAYARIYVCKHFLLSHKFNSKQILVQQQQLTKQIKNSKTKNEAQKN